MTTPSDNPIPKDGQDESPDVGSSQQDVAPGVELGLSEGSGGTFEPEEDIDADG